ncbi:MAG: YhgE/Pip family protein [Anaerovoracaceae bacterium]
MKNILRIFTGDLNRMTKSVVSVVMVIGISILPCMYGWMNVLSTLDPYSPEATSHMSIAVASDDQGTEIYGVTMNIGDTILENLRGNDTLGWEFPETTGEAVDGVRSGEYYAAIIIPEGFSEDMMEFRTGNYVHPQLEYYQNDKANIIASKITDLAKNTVQDEVNGAFMGTLVGAAVKMGNMTSGIGIDGQSAYDDAIRKVADAERDLESILKLTLAMDALGDAAGSMIGTTESFLPEVDRLTGETESALQDIFDRLETGKGNYRDAADAAVLVLDQALTSLETLETWVKSENDAALTVTEDSAQALLNLKDTLNDLNRFIADVSEYVSEETPGYMDISRACSSAESMIRASEDLLGTMIPWSGADARTGGAALATGSSQAGVYFDASKHPGWKEYTSPGALYYAEYGAKIGPEAAAAAAAGQNMEENLKDLKKYLNYARDDIKGLEKYADRLNSSMSTALTGISQDLNRLAEDLLTVEENLLSDVSHVREDILKIQGTLTEDGSLSGIIDTAQNSLLQAADVLQSTDGTYRSAMNALAGYTSALGAIQYDMGQTRAVVQQLQGILQSVMLHLLEWDEDGSLDYMIDLMGDDPEKLSAFLAEPVTLETEAVYEIENYGSASAPFFTLLALWAGALFAMCLFKARVPAGLLPEGTKRWEEFFGRYLFIFFIGQLQALVTGLGILFYVGIDCAHPFLFWLGCAAASLTFTLINFSLAYALDTVGLGISVIIILAQVAGTGGSFPVEVLPEICQKIYPAMPFRFALEMMREAVGGTFGSTFFTDAGMLLLYGLAAIPLGLLISKLYGPLYRAMKAGMKKSGIMKI